MIRSHTFMYLIVLHFTFNLAAQNMDPSAEIHSIENGLQPLFQIRGGTFKTFNLMDRMEHYKVPGVSIAVVENNQLRWAKGYGIANTDLGSPVTNETLFQAGSISKPIAALAVLKLFQDDLVDLDQDVNHYLKDWKIPDNRFTENEKVTMRRLLTHSAGMTVHGFPGYSQKDNFPSISEVLDGKGNTDPIRVDTIPGSIWRYSGGGYTVMEKVVEDITGKPLEVYMSESILAPLEMVRSTYQQPLGTEHHSEASAAYDGNGQILEGYWHNYPEQAAAGLWTTPTDLAKYCIEVQQVLAGKKTALLTRETIEEMLTKHMNNWGLGPSLQGDDDLLQFGHGGKNAGFTNDFRAFAYQGRAVIVMTSGDNGSRLIGEILRSVSHFYDWGMSQSEVVEIATISSSRLDSLAGRYQLDFMVPDIGKYIVELKVQDDGLFVNDPNNGDTNLLRPVGDGQFIDLDTGDRVQFEIANDIIGLLWNNRFQFNKIE